MGMVNENNQPQWMKSLHVDAAPIPERVLLWAVIDRAIKDWEAVKSGRQVAGNVFNLDSVRMKNGGRLKFEKELEQFFSSEQSLFGAEGVTLLGVCDLLSDDGDSLRQKILTLL